MTFIRRLAMCGLVLALCPAALAGSALAQDAKWVANSPRQNWAHTDGVVNLQPGKTISAASLADRLMIQDAFTRWGIGYDEGKLDVVRSLFTQDAVLEVLEGKAQPNEVMHGADEIVASVKRDRAKQADQRRHAISNIAIDRLDKDRATALAYGVVTVAGDGELYLGATVIYRGDLRKQADGNWRFEHFVIGMDSYRRKLVAQAK